LVDALTVDQSLLEGLHTANDEARIALLPKLANRFNELFRAVDISDVRSVALW
jgi:hypothetical protein